MPVVVISGFVVNTSDTSAIARRLGVAYLDRKSEPLDQLIAELRRLVASGGSV